MMLRVLQTVKSREAEYAAVKLLSERIKGLPRTFQLANRDRRLVAQGPLLRMHIDQVENNSRPDLDYTPLSLDQRDNNRYPPWHRSPFANSLTPTSDMIPSEDLETCSEWIYAFIFSDVVVLAIHHQTPGVLGGASDSWELLPDVGISRVLGYADLSGERCV
jgi:hypothetical protein